MRVNLPVSLIDGINQHRLGLDSMYLQQLFIPRSFRPKNTSWEQVQYLSSPEEISVMAYILGNVAKPLIQV